MTRQDILQYSEGVSAYVQQLRHALHRHPELSFHEEWTSSFVEKELCSMGIPYTKGFAQYGIRAVVEGDGDGETVVLRADMDALPIEEDVSHILRSEVSGVMHACGHDMHTAILLGVARVLMQSRSQWKGRVVLLFQPSEEVWPGGAIRMLNDGVLDGFNPKVVMAHHVMPGMSVGHVGFHEGAYMASGDEVHLHIKGHGGHGGVPHLLTDTVLAGAQILVALQELVAREVPANVPTVISFGRFEALGATNIIPDDVYLAGTLRTMSEEWREKMKSRIREVVSAMATAFRVEVSIDIKDGFPSVYNNPELTAAVRQSAVSILGADNVENMEIRTTAEDFGYFTQRYPSVYYRFGVGDSGNVHTSQFNPDEKSLKTSVAVMLSGTMKMLSE
ncbi:MAG: M20 family metallopeptidase [Bacteroidales bacterium]|nr:M20 family metallopeptidase [Bacteroidales bacterium]